MIFQGHNRFSGYYVGRRKIKAVFHGSRLVWSDSRSKPYLYVSPDNIWVEREPEFASVISNVDWEAETGEGAEDPPLKVSDSNIRLSQSGATETMYVGYDGEWRVKEKS